MVHKDQLKEFSCSVHPSEPIQRVCIQPKSENHLCCTECLLKNPALGSRDSFITFEKFLDYAANIYLELQNRSKIEGFIPNRSVRSLVTDEESLVKFAKHIEEEKKKVIDGFDSIVNEFTLLCNTKKEMLTAALDRQFLTFRLNHAYEKSKFDRYYGESKVEELNPDKDTLLQRFNNCANTIQAEILVKNILDDIREAKSQVDSRSKIKTIEERVNQLGKELEEQSKCTVRTSFSGESALQDIQKVD